MAGVMKTSSLSHPLTHFTIVLAANLLFWRFVWGVLIVIVAYLAFTPEPPPSLDLGWDKLNHSSAFVALAIAACFSFPDSVRHQVVGLSGMLAYGGMIEIVQLYIPGRTGEWADLLADSLGIGIGAAMAMLMLRWLVARPEFRSAIAGRVQPRED